MLYLKNISINFFAPFSQMKFSLLKVPTTMVQSSGNASEVQVQVQAPTKFFQEIWEVVFGESLFKVVVIPPLCQEKEE